MLSHSQCAFPLFSSSTAKVRGRHCCFRFPLLILASVLPSLSSPSSSSCPFRPVHSPSTLACNTAMDQCYPCLLFKNQQTILEFICLLGYHSLFFCSSFPHSLLFNCCLEFLSSVHLKLPLIWLLPLHTQLLCQNFQYPLPGIISGILLHFQPVKIISQALLDIFFSFGFQNCPARDTSLQLLQCILVLVSSETPKGSSPLNLGKAPLAFRKFL